MAKLVPFLICFSNSIYELPDNGSYRMFYYGTQVVLHPLIQFSMILSKPNEITVLNLAVSLEALTCSQARNVSS